MEAETVWVRRQWNDWRHALYHLADIEHPHWDNMSGGVYAVAPQYFLHAYVWCDGMVEGELAHSCSHGSGPHRIKICVTKKGNDPMVFARLAETAGPKPLRRELGLEQMALTNLCMMEEEKAKASRT